jgi:hypothetical protein
MDLKLDQALMLAKKKLKDGSAEEARQSAGLSPYWVMQLVKH